MPPQNRSRSPASNRTPEPMDLRRSYNQRNTSSNPSVDQRSMGSPGASHGGAAPNSVYALASPFTRELSDLSGSYANDTANRRGSKGSAVPGHIYDQAFVKVPWRQAYALSQVPPQLKENSASDVETSRDATIFVSNNDVVEIVDSPERTFDLNKFQAQVHTRIPVMILLMDGAKHSYELMQIWIDRTTDSVRDLVQSLQHSIPDQWKQDYDGIFQLRGNRFTQLIHILGLGKYDAQPHEIFIAKPRSMTAKVTIAFATSAIRHLTTIGVIIPNEGEKSSRRGFRPKSEESPLLLSKKAQDRIYAPEGILNHHHAVQFITFSPPLDFNRKPIELNIKRDGSNSSLGSHGPEHGPDSVLDNANVLKTLGVNSSPKSVTKMPTVKSDQVVPLNTESVDDISNQVSQLGIDDSLHGGRRRFGQMVSKLNCCKHKERVGKLTMGAFTLSEEQEHQWSTFDIRPIAEDRSVAGHSIISMSAPLLSSHIVGEKDHISRMEPQSHFLGEF